MNKNKGRKDFQIGFFAINKKGETGGYCVHPGFTYSQYSSAGQTENQVESFYKKQN